MLGVAVAAVVIVARREGLILLAEALERLELARHVYRAVVVGAHVERYHANGVARNQELVGLLVVEREGEDAAELVDERRTLVAPQRQYHLTVAACHEGVAPGVAAANVAVVVNLAVDGQRHLSVGAHQRLPSRLGVDDGQPFMCQYGRPAAVYAAPVGSAVTYLPAHLQGLLPQFRRLLADVENCYYSTHIALFMVWYEVCCGARRLCCRGRQARPGLLV